MDRLIREEIHMASAVLWSYRSVCKRARQGCVITDKSHRRVLGVGYNGPAPRLRHERCRNIPGNCGCLHAEANAVAAVGEPELKKSAFVTTAPCEYCAQLLIRANVVKVFWLQRYRNDDGLEVLREAQVIERQLVLPDLLVKLLP